MADNIAITAGTGTTVATDNIAGVNFQRVKMIVGADGTNDGDVCTANPLPISDAGGAITVDGTVAVTGVSTAANQTTANNSLSSIDGKITACNTGAVVISSGTVSTITNVVHVDDNSGALTVDNGGTFATQSACTVADGANVTLGAKADAKSTATDTTAVTAMQVLKEISYMEQNPASRAVTNAGTFAVQAACTSGTAANMKVEATIAGSQTLATLTTITNDVGIKDNGNSITVDNGGTFAVQAAIPAHATRIQGKVDNADTTTAREVVAAIASNYVYITSFIISVAAAGNYWLEDGDATQITPKFYLAANGGVSWATVNITPYKTNTVNKAINVKGSTAGAVGVMLTGYSATS